MDCNTVTELLDEYCTGRLDGTQRQALQDHVGKCPRCADLLAANERYFSALDGLDAVSPPDGFLDRVHGRIEQKGALRRFLQMIFVPGRIKIPVRLTATAAVAVLVVALVRLYQPVERPGMEQDAVSSVRTDTAARAPVADRKAAAPARMKSAPKKEFSRMRSAEPLLLQEPGTDDEMRPAEKRVLGEQAPGAEGWGAGDADTAFSVTLLVAAAAHGIVPAETKSANAVSGTARAGHAAVKKSIVEFIRQHDGKIIDTQAQPSGALSVSVPAALYPQLIRFLRRFGDFAADPPESIRSESVQLSITIQPADRP